MVMGQGKVMTAVTIALTYAYTWTISAQNTNLQPINDLVEVFGLCLERGLGVELLGNRRVGLGVDLRLLELLGHVESGNCCERSESSSGEGRLDVCRFNTSLDREARGEGCENTSGREHAWIRGKKVLEGVLLYFLDPRAAAASTFPLSIVCQCLTLQYVHLRSIIGGGAFVNPHPREGALSW